MASYSTADLIAETLRELRIADASGTIAPEDDELVRRRYDAVFDELTRLDVAGWDKDTIPGAVFIPLARHLAAVCATVYGVEYMPRAETERELCRVAARRSTALPVVVSYI